MECKAGEGTEGEQDGERKRAERAERGGAGRSGAADLPDRRVNVERRVVSAACPLVRQSVLHCYFGSQLRRLILRVQTRRDKELRGR